MSKTLVIKETRIYRIKDIDEVKVSDYDMSKPISIKPLLSTYRFWALLEIREKLLPYRLLVIIVP